MSSLPATPDKFHSSREWAGIHVHAMNPRSTAKRGTRRLVPQVQALIPPSLGRSDALAALDSGSLDPLAAEVVWLVDSNPVLQPVTEFAVPDQFSHMRVRRVGSFEGATSRPGWYPTYRDSYGLYVEAESRTEMDWLRAIDMEPGVTWLATQPFVLFWRLDDRAIVRYPDILALKFDRPIVVEVKPVSHVDDYTQRMFDLTSRALSACNVEFRHVSSMSDQSRVNLLAVSRYKRPNPLLTEFVTQVLQVRPRTPHHVFTICRGHVGIGIAVLYHLRANGLCLFNLDQPLHAATQLMWVEGRS